MKISKQSRRDAKSLFRATRVNGVLDETKVRQAVQQVVNQKPRNYLAILTHFERLVRLDIARRTALIESATPLTQDFQDEINGNLAAKHGPGLEISFQTNPALIGGLRIKVGSNVYDGSVQGRLSNLENNF